MTYELRISAVESTELFVGTPAAPEQVVRVGLDGTPGRVAVGLAGAGIEPAEPLLVELSGGAVAVEVPVRFAPGTPAGAEIAATVTARPVGPGDVPAGGPGDVTADGSAGEPGAVSAPAAVTVADPGWTVHLVSHFHYDPVWWNTQAAYTESWDALDWSGSPRAAFQHTGFDLVRAHLELTRHDADYRFVLAETDYLKPYWDTHPEDREYLRRLLAEGRCELMGGTYNEPNTNLTGPESTIRNLQYGIGLQRHVLGGDPRTAWQLDVFGHDPQFPGLAADAGLTDSSWARGPFHQWGPLQTTPAEPFRDARLMQFPSEFEWVAPSGRGLLTSYMPAHYSAGWWMDSAATLAEAEAEVYRIFLSLKVVAATRNVLLPVGTDYSPPNKWLTEIHRHWASRYVWPRFVCAIPRDFFAAVRAELAATGRRPVPVSRDMNPIYTGKDVSYVDTKQAQRQAEGLLVDAERFATFAALHGAWYPTATLDKAWRQLVYGAHHDAITGSESDQVYLDLLTGWREAWEIGRTVRDAAIRHLAGYTPPVDPGALRVVVFNGLSWARTDLVQVRVRPPFGAPGLALVDDAGQPVPLLAEGVQARRDGGITEATLTFLARDVPATGYRTYLLRPTATPAGGWRSAGVEPTISNEHYQLTVDPSRGGSVSSLRDLAAGRELLAPGRLGNEVLRYAEYPQHPRYGEGPWHLLPTGPPRASTADRPADEVRVETSPLGRRIVVRGSLDGVAYTQRLTLWAGLRRVDCVTALDGFRGSDQLLRLRWAAGVRGGLPVSEVSGAVIGRGYGIVDTDTADAPWTLDNPAHTWFGLGSTARVSLGSAATADAAGPDSAGPAGRAETLRAIGVAEVVAGADLAAAAEVRDLVVALVRAGVTSTTSVDVGSRYGYLDVDSNLPDVRVAVGGPDRNAFTAAVLDAAGPAYAAELRRQLAATGAARLWVPAERPLADVWLPNADLRGPRALPVLVIAGADDTALAAALAALAADLDDATIHIGQPLDLHAAEPGLDDYSVGVLNRGLPGFAVDRTGALHLSLLRSCTGWPSGVWIDPPRRTAPDGSGFQLQHWSHRFEYALVAGAGDWRADGFVHSGQSYNVPLAATVLDPDVGLTVGGLPPTGSLLSVDPPGGAVVTAVKPAGNPLARGSAEEVMPIDGIAVRLYEPHGRPVEVRLRLLAPPFEAFRADLLERPSTPLPLDPDGAVRIGLAGAEIATVVLSPDGLTGPARLDPHGDREPVQPVSTRYWLHNSGPAPTGNLPVAVHVQPAAVTAAGPVDLRVTVASDRTDDNWSGLVRVCPPDGWAAEPANWPVALPPGAYADLPVRITPPPDAVAGDHLVEVSIVDGGQTVQDLATVTVPGAYPGAVGPGEVSMTLDPLAVSVRPGGRAVLRARLVNRFRSPVDLVAWLIGPVETWELTPQRIAGVRLDADSTGSVEFPVVVPADAQPGSWWLLVKTGYGPRIGYSESVRFTVEARR
jgi:alpha-mannosidase